MSAIVRVRALQAGYDGRTVATVSSLDIACGGRVVITGANGSGKTTVLKTMGGLMPPIAGDLMAPRPGAGGAVYVHPAPFLFAGSGLDNVLLGAHGAREAASDALDALRATAFAREDVRRISNGQRQRIALARALAARPALLLVDETDSGLDAEGLAAWQDVLASRDDVAIVIASPRGLIEPGSIFPVQYALSAP